ncbi:sensor histidine kinase [Saccharibacillus alkalitolerans]|uniref:histidine kinase n=1 Tax=Saccharibacillus alkalitolerans TaxID=2705290 RepID=A0ABX0F6N4_9BACL|nr:HAMP domain-containing sensor histidine kinase [Saccharibacillus alkalitolerans]NGZ75585.1 HAMP domain-containing histidine kinase [Saccharibacillus alkalitolerans]
MKKNAEVRSGRIARRLGLHFTVQFFLIWLSVLTTVFVALFILIYSIGGEQLRSDSPAKILDSVSLETIIEGDSVELPSLWREQLRDMGYWLQIVNGRGETIYAANVPEDVPARYSASQLLRIGDSRRMDRYEVTTLYEELDGSPSLYLLGRRDVNGELLQDWFDRYAENGRIAGVSARTLLAGETERLGASLRVLDGEGNVVQSLGLESGSGSYGALDLVKIRSAPSETDTKFSYYYDSGSGYTWLLEGPKKNMADPEQPMLRKVLLVSFLVGGAVLLLALAVAAWHGYRYGGPLLLFMRGFERMGRGEYEQVFTEKERRKIFRKNGRFRVRYKLYREVIAGFSDMAGRLADARSERMRLEKSREEWMAGISHDLRTPLAAVQGYGHLLESGQFRWSEEELRDMGVTIREKSAYMLELLQDFSLTFELKNHTPGEKLEPLELNEFVRRTVLRYVNDATLSGVSFGFEEADAPTVISANAKWFQRLLDNLISNAVKHNEAGTNIVLSVGRKGDEAWVSVLDDGVGMDEETQSRLFDRYYRGTSTDEGVDGAGLGMSIAYAVVTAHKGTISVRSSPGEGTLIEMRFPAESGGRPRSSNKSKTEAGG